ncbi:Endonuclease-reverse transcriptase [Operophtera brumata]|uniref:Endonuclease-reverse transcriptase n=1 Tax=Operophtera brumata TaxID=104452 RepID=A0A0L7L5X6_OPEBR|nr:Endonuclease-reverse transcriptase [Operophtera brumata]
MEMLKTLRTQINEDNKETLQIVEENITEKINKNVDEKFCKMELEINNIRIIQDEQQKRLDNFDKILRQRNLILFGIAEEERNYSDLEDIVLQIINIKMQTELDRKDIEFIGRVGKKNSKTRPLRLTLTTLGKKISILQQKKTLDGSGSYIKEDYPPQVLETRKALLPQLMEKRQKGLNATLKYDKIIIVTEKPCHKKGLSNSPLKETGHVQHNLITKVSKMSDMTFKNIISSKPFQGTSNQR